MWNEEHNKAFKKLKEKITSQLVLSLPKREKENLEWKWMLQDM